MEAKQTVQNGCTICLSHEENEKKRKGILSGKLVESDAVPFEENTGRTTEHLRHIVFGDHHNEDYRLGTFSRFPAYAPIKVYDLARAGFYYLGDRDRVECFSCGIKVDNWCISDNALSPSLHAAGCDMAHGRDTLNVARPTREVYDMINNAMQGIAAVSQINQDNFADVDREVMDQDQRVGDEEDNDFLPPQPEPEEAAVNVDDEDVDGNNDGRDENRDLSSRKGSSSRRGSSESVTEEAPAKRQRRPPADQDPDQA